MRVPQRVKQVAEEASGAGLAKGARRLGAHVLRELGPVIPRHHNEDGVDEFDRVPQAHDVRVRYLAEHVYLPHDVPHHSARSAVGAMAGLV